MRLRHPEHPEYTVEFMYIHPERALALLAMNTHNRNMRERVGDAYAGDMTAEQWLFNGDTIKIGVDDEGREVLLDGQHRCTGIIDSGCGQWMLVVRGLPLPTQEVIDTGARRQFYDALKLRGEIRCNVVAAVTRRVLAWERGFRGPRGNWNYTPSVLQLMSVLDKYPEIRLSAEIGDKTHANVPITAAILGLCHWLFLNTVPVTNGDERAQLEEDVATFFDRLRDGAYLTPDHAVSVLRRTVFENKQSKAKLDEPTLTAYVIKAWNAYREGREIKLLRWRSGGANPEPFPEPR